MSLAGPLLFDPRSFWGDENVKILSYSQVGIYLRLLSHQWEEGSIPVDTRRLAAILGPVDVDELSEVVTLFFEPEGDTGRMTNSRLLVERQAWVEKKAALSAAGKKGGKVSRKPPSSQDEATPKPVLSQDEAKGKPTLSSSSSSSSSLPEEERHPQKDASCATGSADGADSLAPLDDEDVAIWFHMVKGKKSFDETRVRVDQDSGDLQWAVLHADLVGDAEAYPGVDVPAELRKMGQWLKKNRTNRKTPEGIGKFINTWLTKEQNRGGPGNGSAPEQTYGGRRRVKLPDKPPERGHPDFFVDKLLR